MRGVFFEKVVWGQLLSELCASILVLDKRKIRRLCCTTATRRLRPQTRFVSDFSTRFKTFFRLQSQAHRHTQCVCIQHIHTHSHAVRALHTAHCTIGSKKPNMKRETNKNKSKTTSTHTHTHCYTGCTCVCVCMLAWQSSLTASLKAFECGLLSYQISY